MKREHVVYLLGAGFSAPLGLPVMSNFLEKSKDLFYLKNALTTEQSTCFSEVFDAIRQMSVVKSYYKTDLFNIEEILSILAMQHSLGGEGLKETFLRYITYVIQHYTPEIQPLHGASLQSLFASMDEPGRFFGLFVGSLLQLRISTSPGGTEHSPNRAVEYGVITLNYDLVLENFARSFQAKYPNALASFSRTTTGSKEGVQLAKLHGSVDTGVIVPPTWNKDVRQKLLPEWTTAFDLLSKANHLRIIGYSLPMADAYIKYLLRAASIQSPHLKRIDVLCRDDRSNTVRARYEEFVDFARLRFVSENVTDYLRAIYNASMESVTNKIELRHLETQHNEFFAKHAA